MLKVDSIEKGIVLDHIQAGKAMRVYQYLNLDRLDCSVAIIKNVKSNKMGKKDIIKINDTIDINLDVLGYIDPNITVNIIEDGTTVEKKRLELPEKIVNVVKCKNLLRHHRGKEAAGAAGEDCQRGQVQKSPVHHLHGAGAGPRVQAGGPGKGHLSLHLLRSESYPFPQLVSSPGSSGEAGAG